MAALVWRVWDCELAYSHTSLTGDSQVGGQVSDPSGAEPRWGIYEVDPWGSTGTGEVPHSRLEWTAAAHGVDPEDIDTLIDIILHTRFLPDPDDALAWGHPTTAAILEEIADLPDAYTPGVSDATRREAHLTRIAAVKTHLARVEAAPQTDRQAALVYIGSKRIAPADPLAPMRSIRLDGHRVQARKLAVEWRRGTGRPTAKRKPPQTFMGPLLAGPEGS